MLQCNNIYTREGCIAFSCEIKAPEVTLFGQYFSCTPSHTPALVSVSDDKIQTTILIPRRGALSIIFRRILWSLWRPIFWRDHVFNYCPHNWLWRCQNFKIRFRQTMFFYNKSNNHIVQHWRMWSKLILPRTSNEKLFSINEELQREALKSFYDRYPWKHCKGMQRLSILPLCLSSCRHIMVSNLSKRYINLG